MLAETEDKVKISVMYDFNHSQSNPQNIIVKEVITVEDGKITVKNVVDGDTDKIRISWPMLVFDGTSFSEVNIEGGTARLQLNGKGVQYKILVPEDAVLKRSGKLLTHRNGMVEEGYAIVDGNSVTYTVTAL